LPQALAQAARAGSGYWFVAGRDADGARETFRSYADVQHAAWCVARSLREAGLQRGDVVALVLPDAEAFLTTLFGASMAGLVPASIHPPASIAERERHVDLVAPLIRQSGARALITSSDLVPHFERIRTTCADLAMMLTPDALDAPASEPDVEPALHDIAFVQYTSGSTSTPKGVVLTHANVCANVDAINGPSGLATASGDVAVSWLPLNHDMGFVGMALGPLYSACTGVLMPPALFVRRPVEWLRAITRHHGSISFAPNFGFDVCVRRVKPQDLEGLDLSSWRIAGCGAEPIHAATIEAFAQRFAAVGFRESSLFPSYGLAEHVLAATFPMRDHRPSTETVSIDALNDRRAAAPSGEEDAAVTLVGCGRPFPGHAIRIVDDEGRALPERAVGEIVLAGPSVMLGYYKHDALTAQTIRDGWLHTGDLGYVSGGELFVCGRAKDVIIVNGRKYYPQDLEWAVDELAGVRRGRVVAFGTSERGRADRVVIVVEPSGTVATDALAETIRRQVGSMFGLYVDEVAVVPSGTVGRTTSGKVQRAATRRRYEELRAGG
jgi:fatty-acyl-CoA synthase